MSQRLLNVQALRAIAALLVVLDHLPRLETKALGQPGILAGFGVFGSAGVDLFFVVSGFIMTVTTWTSFGEADVSRRFLLRRALRIYPMYWFGATAFTLVLAFTHAPAAIDPLRLLSTITLLPTGHDITYTIAWSLQFEMFFYVVFSVALHFARPRLPLVLGIWTAAILTVNAIAGGNPLLQFFGNPLALEFIAGMLVGVLSMTRRFIVPRLFVSLGAAALLAACVSNMVFDGLGVAVLSPWHRTLTAGIASALLVYGAVGCEHGRIYAPRGLIRLGDASFSMYLMHGLIVGVVTAAFGHFHRHGFIADVLFITTTYVAVIAGSVTIYHFVEKRIGHALRGAGRPVERRSTRQPAIAPR